MDFKKEIEKAKKEILRGIWKKKPTPLAKVCGKTSVYNNALNDLQNENKVEIYSKQIFVTEEERNMEYFKWVPFSPVKDGYLITPLLIKKV